MKAIGWEHDSTLVHDNGIIVGSKFLETINTFAKKGAWELVSVCNTEKPGILIAFFKRQAWVELPPFPEAEVLPDAE